MGRKTNTHSWHCGLLSGAAPQLIARRDFLKRRGFFFQGEANECGHLIFNFELSSSAISENMKPLGWQ